MTHVLLLSEVKLHLHVVSQCVTGLSLLVNGFYWFFIIVFFYSLRQCVKSKIFWWWLAACKKGLFLLLYLFVLDCSQNWLAKHELIKFSYFCGFMMFIICSWVAYDGNSISTLNMLFINFYKKYWKVYNQFDIKLACLSSTHGFGLCSVALYNVELG